MLEEPSDTWVGIALSSIKICEDKKWWDSEQRPYLRAEDQITSKSPENKLAALPWECDLVPLCLNFFMCRLRIIMPNCTFWVFISFSRTSDLINKTLVSVSCPQAHTGQGTWGPASGPEPISLLGSCGAAPSYCSWVKVGEGVSLIGLGFTREVAWARTLKNESGTRGSQVFLCWPRGLSRPCDKGLFSGKSGLGSSS